jgi:hypothetical protein
LGRESSALLVPGENGSKLLAVFEERLMQRHARPARIREDPFRTLTDQGLDQNLGPVQGAGLGF